MQQQSKTQTTEQRLERIENRLYAMHKHSNIANGIQIVAIFLLFFFSIETIKDLSKVTKKL